ncbi:MAG TPA: dihydropteroate synthase [Thermoanaerobaculia bacterium]|nr:dihydropteroate synthase [Thermoanaerobaculia bacterium]
MSHYLRPVQLLSGPEAARAVEEKRARPLLGGPLAFAAVERIGWDGAGERHRLTVAPGDLEPAQLLPFTAAHAAPFDRPRLMGILNVTPDSFSDGGRHDGIAAAVTHGRKLAAEGADVIDVGGESTRPGAGEIAADEELARVLPVIEALAARGLMVSVDTRKAVVMRAALAAGARMINDVSGLAHDPAALEAGAAATARGAWVVLMHMRGTPATMNRSPSYRACTLEVHDELAMRMAAAEAAGVRRDRIVLDPGLSFAKHEPHNVELLRELALLHGLGRPLMVGISRKGWADWLHRRHRPAERLPASLAAAQWALDRGARLLRVHDVAATRQLLDAWTTLASL